MSYGLEMTEVRYETDHEGKRLKATIPYTMFSTLIEFWNVARRAQTAAVEDSARAGQFRGSLHSVTMPDETGTEPRTPAHTAPAYYSPPPTRRGTPRHHEATWERLLDAFPPESDETDAVEHDPRALTPGGDLPTGDHFPPRHKRGRPGTGKTRQVVFVREFKAPIPDEVGQQVREGVYFLRAWRIYRRLTVQDVAELTGKHKDTVNWHENGYSRPTPETLAMFADIYDCTLDQLTAKPKSNVQPWLAVVTQRAERIERRQRAARAPEDTDYPDTVLAHLIAGKSPLTAWRLYRGLTISQLADAYGTKTGNIRTMEEAPSMRSRTIGRLCLILKCRPEQLLRPEGMPEPAERRPTADRRQRPRDERAAARA
jgi:transcriptional regulator with XRE-family HTH domain/DNA-binding Xre family transcriptional regulator